MKLCQKRKAAYLLSELSIPLTSRRKVDMTPSLNLVPDFLNDKTHNRLDEIVLSNLEGLGFEPSSSSLLLF
jgi:hypothetical protein